MTPEEWVKVVRDAAKAVRWDRVYAPHHALNQSFARSLDDGGLESFHTDALRLTASLPVYRRVELKDLVEFENSVVELLQSGLAIARENGHIKALYFEYFYDGGDACEGNLYLCDQYSPNDDGWAAEFEPSDVLIGPNVKKYLSYDPELDFEPALDCIARYYVDAMFLGAAIRAWKRVGAPKFPFGFALHDNPIVRISEA